VNAVPRHDTEVNIKTLYNEAEDYSIITREEAEKERKVKEEKAAQKAYEDSIRLIQARKNDL
jgi:hypothetical protein